MPPRINLSNIPIWNLRIEFNHHLELLRDQEFRRSVKARPNQPIRTNYLWWFGMESDFLTLISQRAILGLEAYVPFATVIQAGRLGKLNKELFRQTQDPFGLGGRGTAENYFNRLPALADRAFALSCRDPELWEETRLFYKDIRNPLFHGSQISRDDGAEATLGLHEFVARLYAWIDVWSPPGR